MQPRQNISENRRRTYSTRTAFLVGQLETGTHRQDRRRSPYIVPTRVVVRAYCTRPTFDGTLRRNTLRNCTRHHERSHPHRGTKQQSR